MVTKKEKAASKYFGSWGLLMRTRRVLYLTWERRLKQVVDLDPKQVGILHWTVNKPRINLAEVARTYYRDHHSTWLQLQALSKKGLVLIEKNPTHKNRLMLSATEKGVEIYQKIIDREFLSEMFGSLTYEEFDRLNTLLLKLHEPNEKKLYGKKFFSLYRDTTSSYKKADE